jgi:15-cis-phytoene synthase
VTSLGYETAEMPAFPYLDADVQLAMAYAPMCRRDSFAVLFSLDDILARAIFATREPMLGRIRLSWWRENLEAMARGGMPPPEPLFQDLAKLALLPSDICLLAKMAEGWDVLVGDFPLSEIALQDHARLRGRSLFEVAAAVAGVETANAGACGEAWALANFAGTCRDAPTARRAAQLASTKFDVMPPSALPSELRPFVIISHLARLDLQEGAANRPAPGSPKRMLRAARFALFRK